MPELTCPKCASISCERVRREGFLQTILLARIGRFPWRCNDCSSQFFTSLRGHRRKLSGVAALSGSSESEQRGTGA